MAQVMARELTEEAFLEISGHFCGFLHNQIPAELQVLIIKNITYVCLVLSDNTFIK
jgi:hypothetical protein